MAISVRVCALICVCLRYVSMYVCVCVGGGHYQMPPSALGFAPSADEAVVRGMSRDRDRGALGEGGGVVEEG